MIERDVPMKRIHKANSLKKLRKLKNQTRELKMWKQVEAVWLRESLDLNGKETTTILGYQIQTVYQLWCRWKRKGIKMFENRASPGRRKHAYLSEEAEREWLVSLNALSESGELVTRVQIQATYEARVGKAVAPSTVYRALKRHGWRKVVPKTPHPKMVPETYEEAKKNFVVKR